MEITQVAPKGKPDVNLRLTAEEATAFRHFFGEFNGSTVENIIDDAKVEAIITRLSHEIYNELDNLDY